jgi:predicted transcriptional regulator of viral defense system
MENISRQPGLSLGFRLLQELQQEARYVFSAREAQDIGGRIGASNVNDLLHRLARAGLVRRLRRGFYAIAANTPSAPEIPEFYIATKMIVPSAVSHWSAMSYHGLTEQIPRRVTAFTPKKFITPSMRTGKRDRNTEHSQYWEIDQIRYEYLYVLPRSFFGIEEIWLGEFFKVPITDKERTLLEGFINPSYFGGFSFIMSILDQHLREVDVQKLVAHAVRYQTASVIKRLGWALEQLGTPENGLFELKQFSWRGYTPLDPALPSRGSYENRWGIINNLRPGGDKQ